MTSFQYQLKLPQFQHGHSACGPLCVILFDNSVYFVLSLHAVAAQKVPITHPGWGFWLCCGRFCLDLHHGSHSRSEAIPCCPSVPVLHGLQSHKGGENISMLETCASSEPLTDDGKQSSSKDALLSPGV